MRWLENFIRVVNDHMLSWVFACIIFLSANSSLFGQDIYNGTNIYVNSKAEIHLPGDITSKGFVQNNGLIAFAGNWSNTFVYQGRGELKLNGTDQSFFNKNQPVTSLTLEGQGIKKVNGTLSIIDNLNLIAGILKLDEDDSLRIEEKGKITGGSNDSYVNGAIITNGTGYKYFPIGDNTTFYPIELLDVKGVQPVLMMKLGKDYNGETTDDLNLNRVVFWHHETLSGSFEKSAVAIGINNIESTDQLTIAHAESVSSALTAETDVEVMNSEFGFPKIISSSELAGKVLLLAQRIVPEKPLEPFYLPTTLSPNAINSNNRSIRIFGNALQQSDFAFEIFDRSGLMVFRSKSLDEMMTTGWDGRHHTTGKQVEAGIYPYTLRAVDNKGKPFNKHGVIAIVH